MRPCGLCNCLCSARILQAKCGGRQRQSQAHDQRAVACQSANQATPPSSSALNVTCKTPAPNTARRITHKRCGDNFQADDEQQQDHAEFRQLGGLVHVRREIEQMRTDQRACGG